MQAIHSAPRFLMSNTFVAHVESACVSPIIEIYRRLVQLSDSMRESAIQQRWDELIRQGGLYLDAIQQLRDCPTLESYSSEERAERTRLLIEIIDNDAAIRSMTQPELSRLSAFMSNMGRQKGALKMYSDAFESRME